MHHHYQTGGEDGTLAAADFGEPNSKIMLAAVKA